MVQKKVLCHVPPHRRTGFEPFALQSPDFLTYLKKEKWEVMLLVHNLKRFLEPIQKMSKIYSNEIWKYRHLEVQFLDTFSLKNCCISLQGLYNVCKKLSLLKWSRLVPSVDNPDCLYTGQGVHVWILDKFGFQTLTVVTFRINVKTKTGPGQRFTNRYYHIFSTMSFLFD